MDGIETPLPARDLPDEMLEKSEMAVLDFLIRPTVIASKCSGWRSERFKPQKSVMGVILCPTSSGLIHDQRHRQPVGVVVSHRV